MFISLVRGPALRVGTHLSPYTRNLVPWAGVPANWQSIGPNRNPVKNRFSGQNNLIFDKKEKCQFTLMYICYVMILKHAPC